MTSDQPTVSVIVPAYNSMAYLGEALRSIQFQTWTDFEALVVIDAKSDPETRQIAEKASQNDRRFQVIEGPQAAGVSNNRNLGIEKARGQYLAFLDSDDLWLPEKLERQVNFMRQNRYDFSYHSYRWIDERGNDVSLTRKAHYRLQADDLLSLNPIGCLTVMLAREAIGNCRFRQIDNEDWLYWHTLLKERGLIAEPLKDVLAGYRIVKGSRSENKWRMARSRWRHYRSTLALPFSTSLYHFIRYAIISVLIRLHRRPRT